MTTVLSIAGFDPSGGAGVLADIKTFESFGVRGFGVTTSITYQTADEFLGMKWLSENEVMNQLDPLLNAYKIDAAKIGLIQCGDMLKNVISKLNKHHIPIIWDPVLHASAGFEFHDQNDIDEMICYMSKALLITPNLNELKLLFPDLSIEDAVKLLNDVHVLLKGGHHDSDICEDVLYSAGLMLKSYASPRLKHSKHGSGCVLSSAIAAGYAKHKDLEKACKDARDYILKFLQSSDELLGIHYNIN